jgi:hypothetical protein
LESNPMDCYLLHSMHTDTEDDNHRDDDEDEEHLQSPISLSSSRGFHTPPPPRQPPPPFAWHSHNSQAPPPVSPLEHGLRSPYMSVPDESIPVAGSFEAAVAAESPESTGTPTSRRRRGGSGGRRSHQDDNGMDSPLDSEPTHDVFKLVQKSSPRLWSVEVREGRAA